MEETPHTHETLTPFLRTHKRTKQESELMGPHNLHWRRRSSIHPRLRWANRRNIIKLQKKESPHFNDGSHNSMCCDNEAATDDDAAHDDADDDEKVGIERRIMALQRLVPGGEALGIDKLFEETAGYILALQGQVNTMNVLASFFEGLEKENRKFGG